MDTHEYQAKTILMDYGIPVPPFAVASTVEEAEKILKETGWEEAVIKIQVHAGGRGKAGGVKLASGKREILAQVQALLGMKIVNAQTGKEGIICRQVLLTPITPIKKEAYIAALIDRDKAEAVLIASPHGGMEIEEVAKQFPEKIFRCPLSLKGEIAPSDLEALSHFMGWSMEKKQTGERLALSLAKAFVDCDATLIEINPLVETEGGNLAALDAKLSIDENALFRQLKIANFYDPSQQNPKEVEAKEYDLAYIAMDGEIGCMVNGAGLAMATMDIIHYFGGSPANFLDVGGGASKEKVAQGFKIILSDPKVKTILVNIFGGIMNCATLAQGIISAAGESEILVPLIVRMEGTNVEEGKRLLAESGLKIIIANDLEEAAKKAVEA